MNKRTCALLAALALGACTINGTEETAIERFSFEVSDNPRVEVTLDDGSIEVIGTSSKELAVTVIKRARGPNAEAAASLLEQLHVEAYQRDTTVRVEAREAASWEWEQRGISIRSGSLRADVEIRAPEELDLELVTDDGRIEIERVQGRIEAESEDGRVQLRDVQGAVRIRTSDGSVIGSGLKGNFEISSADGRIELDGRFGGLRAETSDGSVRVRCDPDMPSPTEDWTLRTYDGSVTLTLPRNISAELDASTGDGRIENELELEALEKTEQTLRGRLRDGGKLILVRTSDGSIRLNAR
jgi:DUF4097 and DUF4098 domain-containing protein YvlB